MKERKVPLRKCAGCGESKPKKELVRVVRAPDGTVSLDLVGKKRAAGPMCAQRRRAWPRRARQSASSARWRWPFPPKYTTPCRAKLPARRKQMQQHKAVFALSLCRKAGALVTGFGRGKRERISRQGGAGAVRAGRLRGHAGPGEALLRGAVPGAYASLHPGAACRRYEKKHRGAGRTKRRACKAVRLGRRHSAQPPLRRSAHVDRD